MVANSSPTQPKTQHKVDICALALPAAGNFTLLPKRNRSKEGGKSRDNCAHAKPEAYKPKQSTQGPKGQVVATFLSYQPKTSKELRTCTASSFLLLPNKTNQKKGGSHMTIAHMQNQRLTTKAMNTRGERTSGGNFPLLPNRKLNTRW